MLFAGGVQRWVHQLKYEGLSMLGALAGEPLERCFREAPPAFAAAAALVPVPLHSARRRERGFNQAEVLSRELGGRIGIPVLPVLERRRPTRPQVILSPSLRRENMAGAFQVHAELAGFCRGRTLLLVDDVLTTGATLEAAASALKSGGAAEVLALTLARALPGRET